MGVGRTRTKKPDLRQRIKTRKDAENLEDILLKKLISKKDKRIPKAMKLLENLETKYQQGLTTEDEERLMIRLLGLRNKLKEMNH